MNSIKMNKENVLDITSRFLTKNRSRLESTPKRIPLHSRLQVHDNKGWHPMQHFSSLPRRKKSDKKMITIVRERKSSTQSEKPQRATCERPLSSRLQVLDDKGRHPMHQFASLPRRKNSSKKPTKTFRERKSSTQSENRQRASCETYKLPEIDNLLVTKGITSPTGLTVNSIRRLRTMRQSRQDLTSMLKSREAAMLELDSDFEDTIEKVDLRHDDGLTKADKVLNVKSCKEINESTVYPCDLCRRIFYHQHALSAHQMLHSGRVKRKQTKPKVQCSTCNKFFTSKWKLRFHQATHFNEKNTKVLMIL